MIEMNSAADLAASADRQARTITVLDNEIRPMLDTATAAFLLNRKPQTLRAWASAETGPMQPLRINGRLAWSVNELRKILQGAK